MDVSEKVDKVEFNLTRLHELIGHRQSSNKELLDRLNEKSRVCYPFGNTGAGKTTFILYCCEVPLEVRPAGDDPIIRYQAAEELPPELQHLQIGQGMKSCTVHVSATFYQELFIFLDGPGFNDTEGDLIDIANVVSITTIFKQLKTLTPILFIDYPLFLVNRGSPVRQLLTAFSGMFSDRMDLFEEHVVVVFTKAPKGVKFPQLKGLLEQLRDEDSVENTSIVLQFLDLILMGIDNTVANAQKRPMFGRVLVFDPLNAREARVATILLSKTVKPMPIIPEGDERSVFVLNLPPSAKSSLDTALANLKLQVPLWLQEGRTDQLLKHLGLLQQLQDAIPHVKDTLEYCARSVYSAVKKQMMEAKERLVNILFESNFANPAQIEKIKTARATLVQIEDLRSFLTEGPLESLEAYDEWTAKQFEMLVVVTQKYNDFNKISTNLKKFQDLEKDFKYLPLFKTHHQSLSAWVEERVKSLINDLLEIKLTAANVEQITKDIQSLKDASEEVNGFLRFDCSDTVSGAITRINTKLAEMQEAIVAYINSAPTKVDEELLEAFNFLKAVQSSKALLDHLQPDINRHEFVKSLCLGIAKTAIDQLKLLASGANALDGATESFIQTAKIMGNFDKDVKLQTDLELAKAIMAFDGSVDRIIEELKTKVLFRPEGPDFGAVPPLLRQLDGCKWLDGHSFGGNRIEQKKQECIEHIAASLKGHRAKIRSMYMRARYADVVSLLNELDGPALQRLQGLIPNCEEDKNELLAWLQTDIKKLFEGTLSRLQSEHPPSLQEADSFLGRLEQLRELNISIGLRTEHDNAKNTIEAHLLKRCTEWVNIISADKLFKFEEDRKYLDQLKAIESTTDFPSLPPNVRLYEQAKAQTSAKLNKLETQIRASLGDQEFDVSEAFHQLEGAVVLIFHFNNISKIVSDLTTLRATILKDVAAELKDELTNGNYVTVKSNLAVLPPGSVGYRQAVRLIQGSLYNLASLIKGSVNFCKIYDSDKTEWNQLVRSKIKFEQTMTLFCPGIIEKDFYDDNLGEIYSLFDSRFVSELKQLDKINLSSQAGLQQLDEKIGRIELLFTELNCPQHLQCSRKLIKEKRETLNSVWDLLDAKVKKVEENVHDVDQFFAELVKESHPKKDHYQTLIRTTIYDIKNTVIESPPGEQKKQIQRIQRLYDNFNQSPILKGIAHQALTEVNEVFSAFISKKAHQFQASLVSWDFNAISTFLAENKDNRDLINSCTAEIKGAANKQLYRQLSSDAGVDELSQFGNDLQRLQTLQKMFPDNSVVTLDGIKKQAQHLAAFSQARCQALNNFFLTSLYGDQVTALSQCLQQIITIKGLEKPLGMIFIQEVQFAKMLTPVCDIFSNNQQNLESSLSRSDFLKLAESLRQIEAVDSLMEELIRFFGEQSAIQALGPLTITLKSCVPFPLAKKQVQVWIDTFNERMTELWKKQEFAPMLKGLQNIKSKSYGPLVKMFSNAEASLKAAFNTIATLYDTLSKATVTHLENQNWKAFRDGFATLESLTEVEAVFEKKNSSEIRAKIENQIHAAASVEAVNHEAVGKSLVVLNQLSQNIPQFKDTITVQSNELINKYGSGQGGDDRIYNLGKYLEKIDGPQAKNAKDVVSSFKVFSAVSMEIWLQKTAGQDIKWALGEDTDGTPRFIFSDLFAPAQKSNQSSLMWAIDKCKDYVKSKVGVDMRSKWMKMYDQYETKFKELYDEASMKGVDYVAEEAKALLKSRADPSQKLAHLLAHICAVWSKLKSGQSKSVQPNQQKKTFRLQPHPIQVLCFFRLLERTNDTHTSQLIEVLTGEGKSVVLGVVATYFGLHGFDVYSICYSQYLSDRDHEDFMEVFEVFDVQDRITYSTISTMCEHLLNKQGNVRDLTKKVIESASNNKAPPKIPVTVPPSVLLIDEVDVFFGSSFFGNTYNPATLVSNDASYDLLKFIFGNAQNVNFGGVAATAHYKALTTQFPKLKPLIDYEIQKMIKEVKDFQNTPEKPIVNNDIIWYKEQDSITCKKVYGYRTAFQYFQKFKDGEIKAEKSVKEHVGIYIGCGNFSFAEIPKDFTYKMGVSGTLRSLTENEKEIIQSYGIQRLAYAPSIYGGSRLNEKTSPPKVSPISIFDDGIDTAPKNMDDTASKALDQKAKDDWFLRIAQHSQEKQRANRAVIIFFADIEVLNEFKASRHGAALTDCQILEEKEKFKESIIKQATASQTVTLATRPFGRGVDFICRDPATKSADGVHVIQTFVATSEAEQIQIKGRAARQGDPGSHEFMLYYGDLRKFLGTKDGATKNSGFDCFDFDSKLTLSDLGEKIRKLRDDLYNVEVSELETKRQDALVAHKLTKDFHNELMSYDGTAASRDKITDRIMQLNQAAVAQAISKYHLFFCLDESGSMSGTPWQQLIVAVNAFLTKRVDMCNANGSPVDDSVTVVNYSSTARVVLQNQPLHPKLSAQIPYTGGSTNFKAGLDTVHGAIQKVNLSGFIPCLIFMSDGCSDSAAVNGEAEMAKLFAAYPALKVFVVGFGSGCDRAKLTKLAQLGGGSFTFGADGTQLKSEFETISVKLSGGVMAL